MNWGFCTTSSRLCHLRPLTPCPQAPAGHCPRPPASCSYHGEAHVCLLECGTIVGAIPRHGHHLPLLCVCAVDDACGVGWECAQGPGMLPGAGVARPALIFRRTLGRAQPPLWPLPCLPPLLSWFFPAPGLPSAPSTFRGCPVP